MSINFVASFEEKHFYFLDIPFFGRFFLINFYFSTHNNAISTKLTFF